MLRSFCLALTMILHGGCGVDAPAPNPDAAVIDELRKAGSDLSRAHPIDFFFYFPTEAAAQSACDTLKSRHFATDVHPIASTDVFACQATTEMMLTVEAMNRLSAQFESLAEGLGGDYDGWEAPVLK